MEHAGWRWIFYVNVPIGVLAIPLAARFVPRSRPQPCDRLDLVGFLLLSPGLAALVYGLAETSTSGQIAGPQTLGPIVAGLSLVTVFVLHARRMPNPLIDVRLLRNRAFSASAGTSFFLGMGLFGVMFLLPLYYQSARGLTALEAGLLMAPQGIGAVIMMILCGTGDRQDRPGPRRARGARAAGARHAALRLRERLDLLPAAGRRLVVRGMGLGASTMPALTAAFATLESDTGAARARARSTWSSAWVARSELP